MNSAGGMSEPSNACTDELLLRDSTEVVACDDEGVLLAVGPWAAGPLWALAVITQHPIARRWFGKSKNGTASPLRSRAQKYVMTFL